MLPQHQTIGHAFIELQQVDSTNNYATALVHAGMAQHGTAILAHYQTRGKGQRNKSWEAAEGKNITTSIILQPSLQLAEAFLLSKAIALGVIRFFNNFINEEVTIKWPNDLYWRDRKAGGILIENLLSGNTWKTAVAGIGININQTVFSEEVQKGVSMKQITGQDYDVVTLAHELYHALQQVLEQLYRDKASIEADYEKALYKRGEKVKLKKGSRVFETLIEGVSPDGKLITNNGMEQRFEVGEVEWII